MSFLAILHLPDYTNIIPGPLLFPIIF